MQQLGDKIGSKLIAEEVGVPVAPWSGGGVDTLEDATAAAARVGYPLMLKATGAGGGGRGIRKVTSDAELADAYERTRDEAQRAFGSGIVFLERLVTGPPRRRCRSSPTDRAPPGRSASATVRCSDATRRSSRSRPRRSSLPSRSPRSRARPSGWPSGSGIADACTVEFLYHPHDQFFAFLEVNTRLQVEHPITEVTTDTDLVKLQIHVASGGRLGGATSPPRSATPLRPASTPKIPTATSPPPPATSSC